jgi:RNA polymerase sigma-70 factor, ECF subfamily
MDEHAAVDRLKRGDVGGLEPLVDRYHTRAARAAYLVVRDGALAEDVAQDAFVRAFERIGSFDAARPFGPWFMKLVLNEAIAAARRRERAASREVRGAEEILARLADPAAGPHGLAEAGEVRRRVWRALEELPPIQRAAIVERYYLGLSEAEMSERGASPPGTIKRRLHDARKGLSKLLRPQSRAAGDHALPKGSPPMGAQPPTPRGGDRG